MKFLALWYRPMLLSALMLACCHSLVEVGGASDTARGHEAANSKDASSSYLPSPFLGGFMLAASVIQQVKVLLWPTICGLAVVSFSWLLMYFDSTVPGVYPPSPLSPSKYKKKSGHIFHLGYTIGLANGLIAFCLTLWQHSFN